MSRKRPLLLLGRPALTAGVIIYTAGIGPRSLVQAETIKHCRLVETLFDTQPSDPAVIREALEVCDSDLGCAGISIESKFDERKDDDGTYLYRHTFLNGKNYTDGTSQEEEDHHEEDHEESEHNQAASTSNIEDS